MPTTNCIFIFNSDASVAGSYIQIDGLGDNILTMYQFIGGINDTKVSGLEPLLNYMDENLFSKDDPAVNEHHCHTTRKQNNQYFTTHNLYNVDKQKNRIKQIIATLMTTAFIITNNQPQTI